jgi:hypothetical protein
VDHPLCVRGTTAPSEHNGSIARSTAASAGNRAAHSRHCAHARSRVTSVWQVERSAAIFIRAYTPHTRTHTHSQSVRVKIVHAKLERASEPCLARCTW